MLRTVIYRFSAFALLVLAAGAVLGYGLARGQSLPRAGQSFTFGIPEGPDNLLGDSAQQITQLELTVMSMDSGCGVIISPSGYFLDFGFTAGQPTIITLPYNLMQRFDLGKTNKGILVHTSAPVNLTFHDFAPEAGDATQILPDNALDTNYVTFGWGIYDDILDPEHNDMEFVVTAPDDSTIVSITPSVNTLNGINAGQTVTVRLDRGESYIVKADTSDQPSDPSLSGSTVVSTKPVSVISALTCAYVPVSYESCNEILDELIGKKWWGSHFFVEPLGNADSAVVIVLTSDRPFFARVNGGFSTSTNNRLVATFYGTAEISTFDNSGPVAVEAHQLSRGSYFSTDFNQTSDPTLVTVLDPKYYSDTMIWNTPALDTASEIWEHWVPIVCPTTDLSAITLDGTSLSLTGAVPSVINGSIYSAINPSLVPGPHTLIAPNPIFALVTGFAGADAYSFIPGGASVQPPQDTAIHKIQLVADTANVCSEFGVTASLVPPIVPDTAHQGEENVMSLTIPISYDPAMMHFLRVEPHAVLLGNVQYSVDSSTPGLVLITIAGMPFIEGSDLFRVVFEGRKKTAATAIGTNSTGLFGCGDASEKLSLIPITIPIGGELDTLSTTFALSNTPATICRTVTVALTSDSIITAADGFALSQIEVTFDTSAQQLDGTVPGSLLNGIGYTESGAAIGNDTLTVDTLRTLSGGDTLLTLEFTPTAFASSAMLHARVMYVRCYDTLERDVTLSYPISIILDTTHTSLTVLTSTVSLGDQAEADVKLAGLPASANVKKFNLYVT